MKTYELQILTGSDWLSVYESREGATTETMIKKGEASADSFPELSHRVVLTEVVWEYKPKLA